MAEHKQHFDYAPQGELFGHDKPLALTRVFKNLDRYQIPFGLCLADHGPKVCAVAKSAVQCLAGHELEAYDAWASGEGWHDVTGWTSFSLNRNHYANRPPLAKGVPYNLATIKPAVKWLESVGVVEVEWQRPGSRRPGQSRMRLRDLHALEAFAADTIRRGEQAQRATLIEMRNDKKEPVKFHDPSVFKLERQMRDVNRYLKAMDVRLEGSQNGVLIVHYSELRRSHITGKKERMTRRYYADETNVTAYRVFNRNRLDSGGRLYGPFWQNLKKAHRHRIRLDGQPVIEVDYSSLHPRMAYASAGLPMEGDPYQVAGYDRDDVKRALNTAINAETDAAAIASMCDARGKNGAIFTGAGAHDRAAQLLEAMRDAHPAIANYFGSGAGLRFQYTDSEMLLRTLDLLAKRGIAGLPLHDAVLTTAQNADLVSEIMEAELRKTFANVDLGQSLVTHKSEKPQALAQ